MIHTTKILPHDISFIIQGPVYDSKNQKIDTQFLNGLDKTMSVFKSAEFIVSTWVIPAESTLWLRQTYPQIKFIFNEDVGTLEKVIDGVNVATNVNRMIISTINGLNTATRKYAVKLRTDSYVYNNSIVDILEAVINQKEFCGFNLRNRNDNYTIFESHIVNCNLFARNPRSHLPFLYHPGDIFMAGLTSDLIKLFDIPNASDSILKKCSSLMNSSFMELVPEQYIWVKCIHNTGKYDDFSYSNFNASTDEIERSEQFYFNNFIPFSAESLGFCWPKHKQVYFNKGGSSIYNFEDWFKWYYQRTNGSNPRTSYTYKKRELIINMMKIYFFIRTSLLRIKLIRKLAYKIYVKRG